MRRIDIGTDRLTFEARNVNRLRSDLNRPQTGQKKTPGTQINKNIFILRLCITYTAFGFPVVKINMPLVNNANL